MLEFNDYKEQLEEKYKRNLKETLSAYYLTRDLGPSSTAKELGIPRQVVLHFINHYGLKEAKHQLIREKAKHLH